MCKDFISHIESIVAKMDIHTVIPLWYEVLCQITQIYKICIAVFALACEQRISF